jgi:hypothetical protein
MPVSLRALREQRVAFLQALDASPAMSAFAELLRDLADGRPRQLKNSELIRQFVGALPLTERLTNLTSTVQRRMERAGGWVPDDETIRGVLRKMQGEKKAELGRDPHIRRIAPATLRASELTEPT